MVEALKRKRPPLGERKRGNYYLYSSFVNSTIAFTTVAIPIAIATGVPCKALQRIRAAIPNPNQFRNNFFIIS